MIYKEIPSAPGYKISKDGEVIGKMGKPLRPGCGQINIRRDGRTFKRTIKSLLSETWVIDGWKQELEPDEEWKVVNGFDDYIITSKGRVWSKINNRWLTATRESKYYWKVSLKRNKKSYTPNIHMLVGRHFLPEYKEGLNILHDNEELPFPQINYVDNLWAGTPLENSNDMLDKGRWVNGKSNKYQYPGVSQSKGSATFRYSLCNKGKRITVCGFSTALEAHEAYLAKRMEIKGY